jgi:beta-glucosidase
VQGPEVYASGLDLEMPGPGKFYNRRAVLRALDEGLLTEDELDDKAVRILHAVLRYGAEEANTMGRRLDTPEHREAALRVAEESIVLLKNEEDLLPLDRSRTRRILVAGPNAAEARLGGGGSASVTPSYSISPLAGLREICGEDVEVRFLEGCSLVGTMETITDHFQHDAAAGEIRPGLRAEFFNAPDTGQEPDAAWPVPQVDFSWGWASPGAGVFRGSYSVRFSGRLTPPVTGRYRIGVFAQEGCVRLSLDGKPFIEAWDDARNGNFEEKYQTHYLTTECDLEAGRPVMIELAYGKRAARAGVRLEWEIPGSRNRLERVLDEARMADAVIVCAGLSNLLEGGGHDRESIEIPAPQRELIERVAAVNPRTIVALNSGGVLAMPWAGAVPAILQCWYPGQEGGRALAHILFGQANPCGHLPDTIPHRREDHAAMAHYPGDGVRVAYEEGRFIGYRHFERAGIAPHFPFGFGLSYTEFSFSAPKLSAAAISADDRIEATVWVQNIGARTGKAVVQLYVRLSEHGRARPEKELRAFRKIELDAGEELAVTFSLGTRELEHFNAEAGEWLLTPGRYEILAGPHAGSLLSTPFEIL